MSGSGARLGVDLGTTWTAAALRRGGRIEALTLGSDTPAMPSVLADDGGRVIVGERAERQLLIDPAGGLRECKRRLGDTTPMVMAGKPYGAEALMGHLLRHVVETAAAAGGQPDEIVLTHPATWGDYKLDLLRDAGRLAGLGEVGLLPEPVAAALHYVSLGRISAGDVVAVYDFGGGTFDAAVVRCTEHGAEILGKPEGLERLGGVDLDQIVVLHVDQALDGRLRELDTTDPAGRRALSRLRADCTAAKEALSSDTEVSIPVAVPGLHTEVRITRDEFEAAARARVADTLGALDRAIADAAVEPSALAGVLLVGGSSRIPVVAEEVGRHTGLPTLLDADPKLVVALGAAGGSTAMTQTRKDDQDAAPGTPTPVPPPPPPPGAPLSPAAQASARAAALRAAAGKKPKKDDGGFIAGPGVALGLGAAASGVAAAGYAATQLLGDDKDGDKKDEDGAAEGETPDDLGLQAPPDDSLDAFDDLGSAAGARGGGGGGGFGGGGGGGRLRAGPERVVVSERVRDADGPGRSPASRPDTDSPTLADISEARAELLDRFAAWEPPEGADADKVAAFRAEIEELVDRYQPRPGQSPNDALAELRREFDEEVEDFVQDLKLDAVIKDREEDDEDHGDKDDDPPMPDPVDHEPEAPPMRPGFEWVPGEVGPDGRYVPGHWERARARAAEPDETDEPRDTDEPDAPDGGRHWVEGYYDDHGKYVKGHWEDGADPDAPSSPESPTDDAPPPYPPPMPTPPAAEPAPEPADPVPSDPGPPPYTPPVVRDHRGGDDPYSPTVVRDRPHRRPVRDDRDRDEWGDRTDGRPVVRDHRGDDDREHPGPRSSSGATVRDHRAGSQPEDDGGFNGLPGQLEDVFDQVLPGGARPWQQQARIARPAEPGGEDGPDTAPAPAGTSDDATPPAPPESAAPPAPSDAAAPPAPPEAAEPPAADPATTPDDDLLGLEAFSEASAAAPDLRLAAELPAPTEPAPAPAPAPAAPPVPAAPAAEADSGAEPVLTLVDPVPADVPGDFAEAPDFADHEPEPSDLDDETPSDLDTNPHTPL